MYANPYGHNNIIIAYNHPMVDEYKQDHPAADNQPEYDMKVDEEEEEEAIRLSIPSVIPVNPAIATANTTSSQPNEGDDSSTNSLISEVTLMTFSEEKAAMLKSEFISRVEQHSHTRQLTTDEKLALLAEIRADQEKKFKVEMRRQETKRDMNREGERTRHEFFERLSALRVNNIGMQSVQQQQQEVEGDLIDTSARSNDRDISDRSGGWGSGRSGESGVVTSEENDDSQHEEKKRPCRRASFLRQYRRASGLSSSDVTEKRCNSNRTLLKNSNDETLRPSLASTITHGTAQSNTTKRLAIEELIALKMEIANQQATIDTITARLHNSEIENSKLTSSLSQEKNARKAAEKSNEELTDKLTKCRESEIELRREVMSLSSARPPLMKQSSTVDWGDADESDLVDKIKKLEQKNEELSKENSRLKRRRRLSRGESFRTDCTDPPTSIDSSERPPINLDVSERTAPANIGASLRSLGSSIKIPLTKLVRSSSEVSVPSRANCEEGWAKERSRSIGGIDPTTTSDAERKYYSNSPEGGTCQRHEKFQRRWSTGTGWKQKIVNETAEGSRAVRRWGSCNLDDLDEEEEHEGGKGIGGWLGGFSLFGKTDEEIDCDEALVAAR